MNKCADYNSSLEVHLGITEELLQEWDKYLELWDLEQVSEFFRDEETGQVGAICCGRSDGAVSYFRAI